MEAILQDDVFFDFGIDDLYPFPRTGLRQVDGDSRDELRSKVCRFVPKQPGVYGMLDPLGRLIYIGKSKALRNRLLSYFLPNNEEDKAGRIVQSTASIVWEMQPSEFAALLREQYLIRQFQPRFNVQGMPRRQQPVFICLGRQPAEQLYSANRHDAKAVLSIGPLAGAARANRAIEVLNRLFQLRDCSSKQKCSFTEQLQLFELEMRPGCIRLEIQSCLGPCIAACSRQQYDRQVTLAKSFLEGKSDAPVLELAKCIREAAENLQFERAAVLRDDLKAVEWLHRRATDLARARAEFTFVYPVESEELGPSAGPTKSAAKQIWYLIRRGVVEGAIAAPVTRAEQDPAHELLAGWLAGEPRVGSTFHHRPETLALVTSWFRKNRNELKKTFQPPFQHSAKARKHAATAVKV